MSRIIVKGLPPYLTESTLRAHFSKRLIQTHQSTNQATDLITDVRILRDRDGKSRRFGFIGYRDDNDAHDAVKYFNGSYIDTARIEVAIARSFADPRVPMSVKERKKEALRRLKEREEKLLSSQSSSMHGEGQSSNGRRKHVSIDAEIRQDKKLQEFMESVNPGFQRKGNTVIESMEGEVENNRVSESLEAVPSVAQDESDSEYEDLPAEGTRRREGIDDGEEIEDEDGKMMTLDQLSNTKPGDTHSSGDENPGNGDDEDDNAGNMLAKDEAISDLDWLKQRRVRIRESESEQAEDIQPAEEVSNNDGEKQEEVTVPEPIEQEPEKTEEELAIEKINASGRLFLRNILYSSTEQDFKDLFQPYGELEEVHIALDPKTGSSKGFAYIQFKNPKDAIQAYIELDKQIFQGRLLHILPADKRKSHRLDEFDLKNMPLKKQRELKRKANASKQTFAWNSLYMNQDAVLSSVASKLGIQKSELIDPENSSSAVKQALAEAHVIGDVRKYFEERGVDLTKFGELKNPNQRDDRVILVKNFPYGTTREELGELFLPFGKLERLLMPPAGTIAIVQFRDVTAARAAFTKLAFKRFKNGIIYLEKGPKNCFTRQPQPDEQLISDETETANVKEVIPSISDIMEGTSSTGVGDTKVTTSGATLTEPNGPKQEVEDREEDDYVQGPTVSIFIKNLNFSTTTAELSEKFKHFNGFIVAQVKTKPDPKHQGKTLSMGFGFVEFRTKEQADAVISAMDGAVIDGHRIQLKLSHRQSNTKTNKRGRSGKSGKIIVKNLPFEATRKDVYELFSSFGQLKSVRVPKKFDKSARGFAFVEFLLPKEAETAMDQLQGVHLLGRRLVMQYAQEDALDPEEEAERMTKRMRRQAATNELSALKGSSGRRRLDIGTQEGESFDSF